jgi:hypothetical protein
LPSGIKSIKKNRNFLARKNSIAMDNQKLFCFDFAALLAQRHRLPSLPELPSAQLAAGS